MPAAIASRRIVYFTTWKCASTFVARFLRRLGEETDIPVYGPNSKGAFHVNAQDLKAHAFWREGEFICGPIRRASLAPDDLPFDRMATLIHLRDPRDVLVSRYYYELYSKSDKEASKLSKEKIEHWEEQGVDAFVLAQSAWYESIYNEYLAFADRHAIPIYTYEELVTQPRTFLARVCERIGLDAETATRLIDQFADDFTPNGEQLGQHKRRITPGDHRDKLRQETIDELSRRFGAYFEAVPLTVPA